MSYFIRLTIVLTSFTLFFTLFSSPVKAAKDPLPCLNKKFTIIVHIVKDSLGATNITEQTILDNIAGMNTYFTEICVSFEVCEFRYIDNFQYDFLNVTPEWDKLQIKYHESNRINMFFVTDTDAPYLKNFATLAGITNLDDGGIVMLKTANILTYTHEMGHYFGLPHTFETANGNELVDGSNCATSGDGVCDTPADPYAGVENLNGCRFIGTAKDANGDYYDPDVSNIMSYYDPLCTCNKFTHGQFVKMANTYLSNPKMW